MDEAHKHSQEDVLTLMESVVDFADLLRAAGYIRDAQRLMNGDIVLFAHLDDLEFWKFLIFRAPGEAGSDDRIELVEDY